MNVTAHVTAVNPTTGHFFMQDESGGPWSGIYVNVKICEFPDISCVSSADGKLLSPDYYINRGTAWVVEVLGTIMEINGTTALSSVSNIRFIRNDTMPAPTVIATGSIGYNCSSLGESLVKSKHRGETKRELFSSKDSHMWSADSAVGWRQLA